MWPTGLPQVPFQIMEVPIKRARLEAREKAEKAPAGGPGPLPSLGPTMPGYRSQSLCLTIDRRFLGVKHGAGRPVARLGAAKPAELRRVSPMSAGRQPGRQVALDMPVPDPSGEKPEIKGVVLP